MENLNVFADQGGYNTDKVDGKHNYLKVYNDYFASIKDLEMKILEIGVGEGESVRLWSDYFVNSEITAIDIVPEKKKYEIPGTRILIGSQSDSDFLVNTVVDGRKFNIVIDDGSHKSDDIIMSFLTLVHHMAPGGIYVIEDLHTIYEPGAGDAIDFLKGIVDDINFYGNMYKTESGAQFADPIKYINQNSETISTIETLVKSIHFYKSLAFILMH